MALKDDYLNWFPFKLTTGADSTDLVELQKNTNASASDKIAWRIHKIQWYTPISASGSANADWQLCLSTRRGLATMPDIIDMGVLDKLQQNESAAATTGLIFSPKTVDYLPPFVMAGSNISLYWQGSTNSAVWQNKVLFVRVGYTMVTIAGDVWQEIFQTWNFSN